MKDRISVTLPGSVVRDIDQEETNRSRFILEAVERELERRRRERLKASLRDPHPDSDYHADLGVDQWVAEAGAYDEEIVDVRGGREIHWTSGRGWEDG